MKDFSHPNILKLKAVAIDRNKSPCIVMPFMWNGSLDDPQIPNHYIDTFSIPFRICIATTSPLSLALYTQLPS